MVRHRLRALLLPLRLLSLVYLVLVGGLLFWSHAPSLIGWHPRVVLTGSMGPGIRPGDVAVLGPAVPGPRTLPPGRVVLVEDASRPTGYYLHRAVRYEGGRLITRGDANRSEDVPAVEPDRVAGELRLLVPRVGLPLVWWREGQVVEAGIAAAGTWLALLLAMGLRSETATRI